MLLLKIRVASVNVRFREYLLRESVNQLLCLFRIAGLPKVPNHDEVPGMFGTIAGPHLHLLPSVVSSRVFRACITPPSPMSTPTSSYDDRLSAPEASICTYARSPVSYISGLQVRSPKAPASLTLNGIVPW